ncbi:hypothetical protein [Caudoviricetes sp.]|nr:hypothetical protein [Caudoviricetes sp.]
MASITCHNIGIAEGALFFTQKNITSKKTQEKTYCMQ